MKTIFTLQNIHDFLLQKGYPEWNYEVYDRYLGHIKKAKIEDFIDRVGFIEHTNMAFIDKHGCECNLEVKISNFEFKTYRDESNIMGSGSTTYVDKNYTNDWINFLFRTHEEEYAKSLLKHALNEKQRIKNEAEEKIETYRLKIQAQAKGPYTYYKDLEQKAKSVLTVGDITEIEQDLTK